MFAGGQRKGRLRRNLACTHRKFENHLTSWAVLFLLNLMSGKYILSTAELGYRTQKNISFALRRCIGVNVVEFTEVKESICCFLINCLIFLGLSFLSLFLSGLWFLLLCIYLYIGDVVLELLNGFFNYCFFVFVCFVFGWCCS